MLEIAKLIPAQERREILEKNVIHKAVGIASDQNMYHLTVIWQTYIEPSYSMTCARCLDRVLNSFRQLQSVLIELEQQDRLLDDN